MTTMMRLVACLLLLASAAQANFLSDPLVQWSYTLPVAGDGLTRSLRKGNAVVASRDERLLFITAEDASLHILGTGDGMPVADAYEPRLNGVNTTCNSGVALAEDVYGVDYAVYAVIDNPDSSAQPNQVGELPQSRIIAINPDGSLRWTFTLDGVVAGSPAIGNDGIYVSHNIPGEAFYSGKLTVLRDNGQSDTPTIVAEVTPQDRLGPFGPLTVQTVASGDSSRDAVFVAENWDSTSTSDGYVYYLDTQGGDFELKVLSEWGVSSITRPAVSPDGSMLWMGGAASTVAGWVGNSSVETIVATGPLQPDWEVSLVQSDTSRTRPIPAAPVPSTDSSLLFVTGNEADIICLNASSGDVLWVYTDVSRFMCEPKFRDPDGQGVLFTISRAYGDVRQINAQNGEVIWTIDCSDLTGSNNCEDSVEAEFSVSPSNNALYYGDEFGKIVALQIGSFETAAPVVPTTSSPMAVPTLAPSIDLTSAPMSGDEGAVDEGAVDEGAVDEGAAQTSSEGISDSAMIAMYAAAGFVGFVAIVILALVFIRCARRRQKNSSALPFVKGGSPYDPKDPSADTAVPAELQFEPAPYTTLRGSQRKKKKKKPDSASTSPDQSPSRLAAIVESPDDPSEEDYDEEKGFEVLNYVDEEEQDFDEYIFEYKETTPDTSFTASSASENCSPSYIPETDKSKTVSSSGSDGSDFENKHCGALVPVVSDGPRLNYMIDTRPEEVGPIVQASDGQHQTLDNDIPPICGVRSEETTSPVYIEDDEQVTENGALVPIIDSQERSVYAIPHAYQMRSEGKTSPVYIKDDNPGNENRAMLPIDLGNERSRSLRSEATTSPVYIEDEIQPAGYGAVVPVHNRNRRSTYAVEAPPIFMPAVPLSYRTHTDSATSSVYVEDEKQIVAPSAVFPVNRASVHAVGSSMSNHTILMQKLQSVRLERALPPASIYTAETKETEETKQSTMVPVNPEHGLSVHALKSSSTDKSHFFELQRMLSDDTSIYTTETKETKETKETNQSAMVPVNHEHGRSVHALTSPSKKMNSLFEPADSTMRATKSPRDEYKEQLSPGTSVYIDDDGSVEMISDDDTNTSTPVDEKMARRPVARWGIGPDSVNLDACNRSPTIQEDGPSIRRPMKVHARKSDVDLTKKQPETPRKDRSLPSMGSDRGGFLKRSPQHTQRPSLQKPISAASTESTETESSARSMRKMRLSRSVQEWKAHDPSVQEWKAEDSSVREWKAREPSVISHGSSEYNSADGNELHKIPMNMAPKNTLKPRESILTSSESDTSGGEDGNETSTTREESRSSRPIVTKSQTSRRLEKPRSAPKASSSRQRTTNVQTRGREEKSQRAQETSPSRPGATTAQFESRVPYFVTGLLSKVEEYDRKFFNPTLPPPTTTKRETKNSSSRDAPFLDITVVRSDDESLPPPPPPRW